MKKPIVMTLGITSLLGIVFGMIFNGFSFGEGLNALYSGFTVAGSAGIAEEGFSDIFLNLCNRGGATSMVSPAIIVIVASMYGTILMEIKALDVIAETVFSKVKSRVLSVSYTHLDVYKRQPLGSVLMSVRIVPRSWTGDKGPFYFRNSEKQGPWKLRRQPQFHPSPFSCNHFLKSFSWRRG